MAISRTEQSEWSFSSLLRTSITPIPLQVSLCHTLCISLCPIPPPPPQIHTATPTGSSPHWGPPRGVDPGAGFPPGSRNQECLWANRARPWGWLPGQFWSLVYTVRQENEVTDNKCWKRLNECRRMWWWIVNKHELLQDYLKLLTQTWNRARSSGGTGWGASFLILLGRFKLRQLENEVTDSN